MQQPKAGQGRQPAPVSIRQLAERLPSHGYQQEAWQNAGRRNSPSALVHYRAFVPAGRSLLGCRMFPELFIFMKQGFRAEGRLIPALRQAETVGSHAGVAVVVVGQGETKRTR